MATKQVLSKQQLDMVKVAMALDIAPPFTRLQQIGKDQFEVTFVPTSAITNICAYRGVLLKKLQTLHANAITLGNLECGDLAGKIYFTNFSQVAEFSHESAEQDGLIFELLTM